MTENKRFTVEDDDADIWEDNHFLAVAYNHHNAKKITKRLNKLADENKQLKHNNRMLSMKMSEVYTNYRLLKEFSEDTNPNDAVKRVLSELMQITKEYR